MAKHSAPRASKYHTPMKSGSMAGGKKMGNKGAASKYHKLAASPKGLNAST